LSAATAAPVNLAADDILSRAIREEEVGSRKLTASEEYTTLFVRLLMFWRYIIEILKRNHLMDLDGYYILGFVWRQFMNCLGTRYNYVFPYFSNVHQQ